jgi:hypothetical protein
VQIETQHNEDVARLMVSMKRYRTVASAVLRPAIFAIVAVILILVVLPAALAAQAGVVP